MKADYSERARKTLQPFLAWCGKAVFKQVKFLEQNLRQARVNKDWRFYFLIRDKRELAGVSPPQPRRIALFPRRVIGYKNST